MADIYEGDRPYIFVNYAHADRRAALPIIHALACEGYRVWYDDGIQLATVFPEYIADHIHGCDCFVMLVSRASLASDWCKREVYYALELNKTILPIYLEDVELTRGLRMSIGAMQSLQWHKLDGNVFYKKLFGTPALYRSLDEQGKAQRGVKPRMNVPGDVRVSGAEKRDTLADYSWDELKRLSFMIANAGSDGEGLGIARAYGLVGEDGRLQGDKKPLWLKDGTRTSVRILGFRHDELAGGGRAGITFEFADVLAEHRMNPTDTNEGGWKGSDMRGWLNDAERGFLGLLPGDLRSNVAEARKLTNNRGGTVWNDTLAVTATDDRLWLLSPNEVYGALANVYGAEGHQYQLYADMGVSTASYDFCEKDGADSWWWLRSPSAGGAGRFHNVYHDGGWNRDYANFELGVSPVFCF